MKRSLSKSHLSEDEKNLEKSSQEFDPPWERQKTITFLFNIKCYCSRYNQNLFNFTSPENSHFKNG